MELPASWLLTAETQFFQAASQSAIILSLLFLYKAMLLLYKAIILRLLLQGHHPDWACSARRRFLRSDSLAFFLSLRARSLNSSNVRGWLNYLPPRRTILSSGGTRDSRQATFASATNLCSSKVSVLAFHRISSLSFSRSTCNLSTAMRTTVRPCFPLPTSANAGHEPWSWGSSLGTPRIQSGGLCLPTKRDQEFLEWSCQEAQCRRLLPHWQQWVMIKRSLVENYTLKVPTLWAPDLGAGFQNEEGSQYDKRKKYASWNTQCLDYGLCVWTHQGRWDFRSGIEDIRHHCGQHRSFWPSCCCSIICHEAIRHHCGQHRSFWPSCCCSIICHAHHSDGTSNCRCIVAGVQLHLAWANPLQRRKKAMDWQSCWVHGLKAFVVGLWSFIDQTVYSLKLQLRTLTLTTQWIDASKLADNFQPASWPEKKRFLTPQRARFWIIAPRIFAVEVRPFPAFIS